MGWIRLSHHISAEAIPIQVIVARKKARQKLFRRAFEYEQRES